ncbi:hypothetical protein LCGC14_0831620 [marine sediment metagenome]|uniref:Uncharacterized protein n=1 Tax=marine sediment metagenome TaxID=412755 RepID=A0A0F9SMV8_9ZZZZ
MSKKESNPGPSFKRPPAPPRPPERTGRDKDLCKTCGGKCENGAEGVVTCPECSTREPDKAEAIDCDECGGAGWYDTTNDELPSREWCPSCLAIHDAMVAIFNISSDVGQLCSMERPEITKVLRELANGSRSAGKAEGHRERNAKLESIAREAVFSSSEWVEKQLLWALKGGG